jgi:hypothetical protein
MALGLWSGPRVPFRSDLINLSCLLHPLQQILLVRFCVNHCGFQASVAEGRQVSGKILARLEDQGNAAGAAASFATAHSKRTRPFTDLDITSMQSEQFADAYTCLQEHGQDRNS